MASSSPKQESARQRTVIVVDDDGEVRSLLADALGKDGHRVDVLESGDDLLRYVARSIVDPDGCKRPDLVVMDVRMPGPSGLDVLASLRSSHWAGLVILVTAFGDAATHAIARRLGALAVLDKPFEIPDLRRLVREALEAP